MRVHGKIYVLLSYGPMGINHALQIMSHITHHAPHLILQIIIAGIVLLYASSLGLQCFLQLIRQLKLLGTGSGNRDRG